MKINTIQHNILQSVDRDIELEESTNISSFEVLTSLIEEYEEEISSLIIKTLREGLAQDRNTELFKHLINLGRLYYEDENLSYNDILFLHACESHRESKKKLKEYKK